MTRGEVYLRVSLCVSQGSLNHTLPPLQGHDSHGRRRTWVRSRGGHSVNGREKLTGTWRENLPSLPTVKCITQGRLDAVLCVTLLRFENANMSLSSHLRILVY